MTGTIARGDFPEWRAPAWNRECVICGHKFWGGADDDCPRNDRHNQTTEARDALTLLNKALDYSVTAITDLDRGWGGAAREDICEALIHLRALRAVLSPNPAMERPIGGEFLQEWLRR